MAFLLKKERRKIYARRVKGFWFEFSHKKIGLFGLGLLMFFAAMAIFSPWLTPYDPLMPPRVAEKFAMPDWITIFPQYRDYPRTIDITPYWSVAQGSELVKIEWGRKPVLEYLGGTTNTVHVILNASFTYPYKVPPKTFWFKFDRVGEQIEKTQYSLRLSILDLEGKEYKLWSEGPSSRTGTLPVNVESGGWELLKQLGLDPTINLAGMIFTKPSEYYLLLHAYFTSETEQASCKIGIEKFKFTTLGLVHGLLGADSFGHDVITALIYGSRISMAIGLIAAVLATSFGTLVGVVAGYVGGRADEVIMRINDIMMCVPDTPLILTLVFIFGPRIENIIIVIAIFGWQGLARVVRSHVLSLRETAFVECALASGANKRYIMIKHLIPNVYPIIVTTFVLRVPGAILREATLSFLGFGDPRSPTWGEMLRSTFAFGAYERLAWWWIVPPGLAITFLCLSFVFMGHAIDEIINPRLRRRR